LDIKTRVRNILLTPNTEWPAIAEEPTQVGDLVTGYVMPLAAIGAIAGFIGASLVGMSLPFLGTYRVPIMTGLAGAVFTFVFAIIGVFILAFIINALAPTFGAQKDSNRAFKVAVYSYTPAWIAGALHILPALAVLGIIAALYGLYLLYLGLPALMKAPQEKAIGYTAVVVVCAIVLSIVVTSISGLIMAPVALSGVGAASSSAEPTFDPNSPMGKLEALGRKMEESGAKMEQAQKSGDKAAETAAAFEGLGALLGGGKHVDAVSIDQLKPLVPDQFAGLARKSSNAERNGMAGIMVSKAEASYGDDAGHSASLEITDSGGATGLLGMASWAALQGERDNDQASERTERIGGRLVHQKISKTGGTHEYNVVIADRFIVTAKANGIEFGALKSAVAALDLQKLEAMKDVGVVK
jgi:Yip1 domain